MASVIHRRGLMAAVVMTFLAGQMRGGEAGSSSPAPAPKPGPDVTVVRSDEHTLVFEYRPRYADPKEVTGGGQTFTLYDFAGSIPAGAHVSAGKPDLRYRNIPIALPAEKGNAVQVVASDYEDIQAVALAPVPQAHWKGDMVDKEIYAATAQEYKENRFLPGSVADLSQPGQARSLLVAGVHIYPVQYNPATRTVRRYSRIVVQVVYGPQTTRAIQNKDEVPFRNSLLNYTMAAGWKVAAAPAVIASSVLKSGNWYRLTVNDDGVYRIDQAYLAAAGINTANIDPRTIKIYGNGGREVPENLSAPRPADLVENAIYVEGESDGQFNTGDYVLFYGRSVRGWTYDANGRTLHHYINHYTESNYYWLTFGGAAGKRMASQASLNNSSAFAPDKFIDGVAVEKESENLLQSGKDWVGQRIDANSSYTLVNQLPGLMQGGSITYRYQLVAASDAYSTFTVREKDNGTTLGFHTLPPISIDVLATFYQFEARGTSSLSSSTSQLNFAYQSSGSLPQAWIDWVEIIYPRMFWGVGDYLHFRAPDTTAVMEYRLQQFTTKPMVFNVTTPTDVRLISGVVGSYSFQASENLGAPSEYVAAGQAAWKQPAAIQAVANQDLRGFATGADFVILTSPEFRSAADRLAAYREQPAHGNLRTVVVDVNQIYNEFGGGLPDVTAIRDYLKYAYDNWTRRPAFALLLGGASYDYKGIMGSHTSFVPIWQTSEPRNGYWTFDDVRSYATDDYFAKFTNGSDATSLVLGRIGARTTAESDIVVDKIIRYEDNSARDNWKMRICYVGDDSWTTEGEDGTIHSAAAEALAAATPDEIEKKKIYIAEYPTEYQAQGRRKPGAYQAIIDQINQGILVFNFAGHGNPTQLAHENIFNVATSIPQLVNSDRLTMFFLATCNFSQFDDRGRESGGELLMNKPDGGAVAVISATRKVYAYENSQLSLATYGYLFSRDQFGHINAERPATALYTYKATGGNGDNDQKFFFMGDPTMRLQFPSGYAAIDSINQQSVDTVNGIPRTNAVLMRALSQISVSGTIRDNLGQIVPSYNGTLTLQVNDPTRVKTIVNFWPGGNWAYLATGGVIFRGENSIVNGKFHANFVVPKDVSLADSTARGRMTVYYSNGSADGEGYTGNIRIGGPDSSTALDGKGPKISIYLDNRSFRAGDMVSDKPLLIVDLADSNGINTSSSGIGHRIEAWVNTSTQSQDITDAYTSKLDNFREGTVQYSLSGLPQGRNTLRVRAWDSFDNSATAETFFDVSSGDNLTLSDVMNYPNPFASATSFTFRQNQTGLLNVKVKIYTVAGRLIQTLATTSAGESFVRVPWDGRDRDGDILANGVYLYKVIVSTADGRFTSEALGKLAVAK